MPIHSLSNYLPTTISSGMQTVGNHIADRLRPSNFVKVGLVVTPVFTAMQMISNVPGAAGGFGCFVACWSLCTEVTLGAMAAACVPACVAFCATNPV